LPVWNPLKSVWVVVTRGNGGIILSILLFHCVD
jgi:hypothetical protein